jgi:HSP20 family protein
MAKSINRYFQLLSSSKNFTPSGRLWYPSADVSKTSEGWLVKVELAGVSAEEVEIEIQGNTLYLAGTRRDHSCGDCISVQQMEIAYSRFEKTLRFPEIIEGAKVEHNFENGLLIIHLRKKK